MLQTLAATRRLIVCVGPGGVGKTTVAAGLGVLAAQQGKRVLVLTIDPARRLADALGLSELSDAQREVPRDVWGEGSGRLFAAMLETRASFDALMERLVRDEAERTRLIDNVVYRAFSKTLARSHAYVATERLYDVLQGQAFDLVVLDTPPLRSALEILDAPGRLVRFLDDGVLRWFVEQSESSRWSAKGIARSLFAMLAGDDLASRVLEFFGLFLSLREGFAARAETVQREFRDARTAFVLVTAPDAACLEDAAFLGLGLQSRGVSLQTTVFNRASVFPDAQREAMQRVVERLQSRDADQKERSGVVQRWCDALLMRDREVRARAESFAARVQKTGRYVVLPELERDAFSLRDWARTLVAAEEYELRAGRFSGR